MKVKVIDLLMASAVVASGLWLFKKLRRRHSGATDGLPPLDVAVEQRGFTAADLAQHRGDKGDPTDLLVSVKGIVYHVTPQHYGVGANYHCFAGTDASYRLGKSLLGLDDANREWRGTALTDDEHTVLNTWAQTIARKYPVVGWFVNEAGERTDL